MYKSKFLKLSILFLIVVLLASLSLFGCKTTTAETTAAATTAAATTAAATTAVAETTAAEELTLEEKERMDTIILGEAILTRFLDPMQLTDSRTRSILNSIYEGLTEYNPDDPADPLPCLAVDWQVNDDATEWTFNLRKGVKFYPSGNEMTAEDVLYSLKRGIEENSPSYPPVVIKLLDPDTGIEIIDDYTVKITLKESFSDWPIICTLNHLSIVDKEELEKRISDEDPAGSTYLNDHSVGTGPFYLEEWAREERIVLERNDDYWGISEGYHRAPKYKTFISLNVPEPATQEMMLLRGDIDFTKDLPREIVAGIESEEGVKIVRNPIYVGTAIMMNPQFAPLSDPNVRMAIKHAIDYETIVNEIVSGMRQDRPYFTPMLGTDEDWIYSYDLDKAKELMAQSNYPDGFEVTHQIGTGIGLGAEWETLALQIQSDLAKIGIITTIEQYEWSIMDENIFGGNYEMLEAWWGPPYPTADGAMNRIGRGDTLAKLEVPIGYENDVISSLADQALAETDLGKRYELYRELAELYYEDGPVCFVAQQIGEVSFREDIQGWNNNPYFSESDYAVIYRQ